MIHIIHPHLPYTTVPNMTIAIQNQLISPGVSKGEISISSPRHMKHYVILHSDIFRIAATTCVYW